MKKMTKNIAALIALGIGSTTIGTAQVTQQKIGDNPTTIHSSAVLEAESTNKGVLLPRVALTDLKDAFTIADAANSLTVFNTATSGTAPNDVMPGYYYWKKDDVTPSNSTWVRLVSQNDIKEPWRVESSSTDATLNNQNIYQNGNVGIGDFSTTNPIAMLDVRGAIRGGIPHPDELNGTSMIGPNSIAVGENNKVAAQNSVAIGRNNTVSSEGSVVFGENNIVTGYNSFVAGGLNHKIDGWFSNIGGGTNNNILSGGNRATIAGGQNNVAIGMGATVSGGSSNTAGDPGDGGIYNATVSGGFSNNATGMNSTVSGGAGNIASSNGATVAGGGENKALSVGSIVAGGFRNISATAFGFVSGSFNAITTSDTGDSPSNALFQIGNGYFSSGAIRNNAVTILSSGKTAIGVTGAEAAAKPTELLDLGGVATAGNGGVRIRNINSPAYTGVSTNKIVVADGDGILKTVDQSGLVVEPWNKRLTNDKATLNADNIYQ